MAEFQALAPLIAPLLDQEFDQLPPEIQALWKERIFLFGWDAISPEQRLQLAKQQDYEHDPATEAERAAIWQLFVDRDDIRRQIGDLEPVMPLTVTEVIAKEDRIKALRKSLSLLDDKVRTWRGDHPEATMEAIIPGGSMDPREKKALLMIVGALVEIALGKYSDGTFETQDALSRFIADKYEGFYGVSLRNLQDKFASANKLLLEP